MLMRTLNKDALYLHCVDGEMIVFKHQDGCLVYHDVVLLKTLFSFIFYSFFIYL